MNYPGTKIFVKAILFVAVISGHASFCQTNTFPASGDVGVGTLTPTSKLDVRGYLTIEANGDAVLYTGTGNAELNRYLRVINASGHGSASGLMAGGYWFLTFIIMQILEKMTLS